MLYPLPAVMVSCPWGGGRPNITPWRGPAPSAAIRRWSIFLYRKTGILMTSSENQENLSSISPRRNWRGPWDVCGVKSGRDIDKFKEMNLTPVPVEICLCAFDRGVAGQYRVQSKTDHPSGNARYVSRRGSGRHRRYGLHG